MIDSGLVRGQLFIPMHWTRQFSAQANVDGLVAAHCCPDSGQPALKQTAVRLQPLRPAWQGWLFLPEVITPQPVLYWSRAPQQGAQRYVLAGEAQAADWLMQLPAMQELQWQQARAGQQLHMLGWRNGRLMCAFYAAPWLPEIDHGFVARAFTETPLLHSSAMCYWADVPHWVKARGGRFAAVSAWVKWQSVGRLSRAAILQRHSGRR